MPYARITASGTSSLASAASARVAAISISPLIFLARTSSAPRKMKGKPSTLFTWFGKSERPVAMMASGRACRASSGMISGVGFASANTIEVGPLARDHAHVVAHQDVVALHAEAHVVLRRRDRRRPRPREHDPHAPEVLLHQLHRV